MSYSKSTDQPDIIRLPNPARDQLRKNISLSSPFAPENSVSRDGFGSPVLRQPAHLHTQSG